MSKLLRYVFLFFVISVLALPAFSHSRRISRHIADKLLVFQNDNGGWLKNYRWDEPLDSNENKKKLEGKGNRSSTIDNGATYSEIRYLSRAYLTFEDKRYRDAALRGINYLLKAQYDNGGWPQFYPYPEDSYHRHITFNDNAMIGTMELLRDISQGKLQFSFIDREMRNRAAAAVKKGIDCILKCQIVVNGKKTAWCAQHDEVTFEPRKARSYELVSISGSESVGVVRFLMDIENPSPEIIEAIEGAVAWFEEAKIKGITLIKIANGSEPAESEPIGWNGTEPTGIDRIIVKDPTAAPMWARFFEIGTNKPIYCSRDGIIKRNLSEISEERRNGYGWIGWYAAELLKVDYPNWKKGLKKQL